MSSIQTHEGAMKIWEDVCFCFDLLHQRTLESGHLDLGNQEPSRAVAISTTQHHF